jgi:hypothetical protein
MLCYVMLCYVIPTICPTNEENRQNTFHIMLKVHTMWVPVTMTWNVLVLQWEETVSRSGG